MSFGNFWQKIKAFGLLFTSTKFNCWQMRIKNMCHKITNKSSCEKTGKSGDFRNAEKGNYIHCLKTKGERYSGQVVTSEENDWRLSTYHKSERNKYVLCQHFKIDGLHYLKFKLHQGDFLCKLDLIDAYFSVHLEEDSKKVICFKWQGSLYFQRQY